MKPSPSKPAPPPHRRRGGRPRRNAISPQKTCATLVERQAVVILLSKHEPTKRGPYSTGHPRRPCRCSRAHQGDGMDHPAACYGDRGSVWPFQSGSGPPPFDIYLGGAPNDAWPRSAAWAGRERRQRGAWHRSWALRSSGFVRHASPGPNECASFHAELSGPVLALSGTHETDAYPVHLGHGCSVCCVRLLTLPSQRKILGTVSNNFNEKAK